MEKYLIEQYGVIEDEGYLKEESDIEDYFEDYARENMDCGQGYFQDEAEFICKIGDKFYEVYVSAEIESAKQDIGDRLYWIGGFNEISYREIEKPKPKPEGTVMFEMNLTKSKRRLLADFLRDNGVSYKEKI